MLHASGNSVIQSRLESSRSVAAQRTESLVRLSQTQTAYQAALQSGAQLLQSSLLDPLR